MFVLLNFIFSFHFLLSFEQPESLYVLICFKEEEAPSMPLTWFISWALDPISACFSLCCFPPLLSQADKLGTQTAAGISPSNSIVFPPSCPFQRPFDAPSATRAASVCSTMALGPGFGIRGEICPWQHIIYSWERVAYSQIFLESRMVTFICIWEFVKWFSKCHWATETLMVRHICCDSELVTSILHSSSSWALVAGSKAVHSLKNTMEAESMNYYLFSLCGQLISDRCF